MYCKRAFQGKLYFLNSNSTHGTNVKFEDVLQKKLCSRRGPTSCLLVSLQKQVDPGRVKCCVKSESVFVSSSRGRLEN